MSALSEVKVQSDPAALFDLIQGSVMTQAIYVAAELGIADMVAERPLAADEIAGKSGAHPEAVYRLLRMLASLSIFAERDDGCFELTPMAEPLRTDSPVSMRGIAQLMGHPLHWADWSHFRDVIQTGEPSFPEQHGVGIFEYFQVDQEFGAVFDKGMGNLSAQETAPLLTAYDYSRFETIVDVGGGRGSLLAAILENAPGSRGILFDDRATHGEGEAILEAAGVAARCTIEGGSFFGKVPPGGDAYILKHIVHDWPEPKALEILKNVREAIPDDGTLLIMEFVVPDGNARHVSKLVDLWLMLLVGGRERTAAQYSELLAKAGFRLDRVVPTQSPVSIVEARPI